MIGTRLVAPQMVYCSVTVNDEQWEILSLFSQQSNVLSVFPILFCRQPGASLIIIKGHRHLHECAYIGDDSSEEADELAEIEEEKAALAVS